MVVVGVVDAVVGDGVVDTIDAVVGGAVVVVTVGLKVRVDGVAVGDSVVVKFVPSSVGAVVGTTSRQTKSGGA
jgi:hypothetical protein